MAKATKGSFMNAILEQKRAAEPEEAPREPAVRPAKAPKPEAEAAPRAERAPRAKSAAQNTPVARNTAVAENAPVAQIAYNTEYTYDTHHAPDTHVASRRKRELTRLNLALDADLLRDMEDLAIVRGKKSLTALISDVMAAEIALSREKIEAYRKIKG